MKALVTGFHMLYRLSPDSKYPWSGENTGPIEIPVLNVPLLESGEAVLGQKDLGVCTTKSPGTPQKSPGSPNGGWWWFFADKQVE